MNQFANKRFLDIDLHGLQYWRQTFQYLSFQQVSEIECFVEFTQNDLWNSFHISNVQFWFYESLQKMKQLVLSSLSLCKEQTEFSRIQNLLWMRTQLSHEIRSTNLKYLSCQDFYLIPLNLIPKWHISPLKMIIFIKRVVVFNMYCKISQVLTKGGLWVLPGSCY